MLINLIVRDYRIIQIIENEGIGGKNIAPILDQMIEQNTSVVAAIKGEELSESVNTFINDNKLTKIEIDPFTTITQEERLNGSTYITLMNNIIDEFKKELFK